MTKKDRDRLIKAARKTMQDPALTEALSESIEAERGEMGFLLKTLKARPRNFNPFVLKGMNIYKEPTALDPKTSELAALAAAAALRCEHCIEAHIERAINHGATLAEVLDVFLIAGAIADSSTLSIALRKYKQFEGRQARAKGKASSK